MPVVQVRNWSDVTPAFLRREWDEVQRREYDMARAYFPFWLHALGGYSRERGAS